MNVKLKIFKNLCINFSHHAKGNISTMFAMLLIPLAAIIGGAIDFTLNISYNSKIQQTLDTVSISLAKAISKNANITDSELSKIANIIYNANIKKSDSAHVQPYQINRTDSELLVTQTGNTDTIFMRLVGVPQLALNASSKVNIKRTNVEMALVLDMSGSMNWDNKLNDLKAATRDLIKILIKDSAAKDTMRIGFVPWSVGVNVQNLQPRAVMKNNNWGQYNCAASRYSRVIDADPKSHKMNVAFIYGREQGPRSWSYCPASKITSLTSNKNRLLNEINSWTAFGGTSSNTGLEWGWGVISPKWKNFWNSSSKPNEYASSKKFIVLMSDGENNDPILDTRSIALCNAMKQKEIKIFSIAFKAPESAKLMLKNCATDNDSYIDASSSNALKAAFQKIADEVGSFYLSG